MPELPEVETVVRDLRAAGLPGSRVRRVRVLWPRSVAGLSAAAFARALKDRIFLGVTRRGKHIIAALDNGRHLLAHLRMTGQFHIVPVAEPLHVHDRVIFDLADGRSLRFRDARKFGRFRLVDRPDTHLASLGPEPLDPVFTRACLDACLSGRRGRIKPVLLDQTCIAGIGNIYADEALWAARIHPLRLAGSLTAAERHRLHTAIRDVLARAVEASGTTLGRGQANFYSVAGRRGRHADALRVFRRTGEPCPRCGHRIERRVVGGRGTHVCPHCQQA